MAGDAILAAGTEEPESDAAVVASGERDPNPVVMPPRVAVGCGVLETNGKRDACTPV
jgi:hypothetical protein